MLGKEGKKWFGVRTINYIKIEIKEAKKKKKIQDSAYILLNSDR